MEEVKRTAQPRGIVKPEDLTDAQRASGRYLPFRPGERPNDDRRARKEIARELKMSGKKVRKLLKAERRKQRNVNEED